MNGSVTPKVISCLCPLGSGFWAISSSRWFCQKRERQGDGEDDQADDEPVAELVEVLDEAELVFVGDRPDATRHPGRPQACFVGDDLGLVRFDPVGRRRFDRAWSTAFGRADRFGGVFLGVVVVFALAGDRVFELADPFAEAVAELRQPFGAEHDQGDDQDDDDLEGADVSEHFVNGNGPRARPDQL